METELFIEPIPTWALCYVFNGDATGLTDDEIQMIDAWLNDNQLDVVCEDEGASEYFTTCPSFGLPTTVIDCKCYLHY